MISLDPEIRSTYEDSVDENSVNMMDTEDDPTTPSKLQIQYGLSKFQVKADSCGSKSLVTDQMTKDIEERDINTWSRTINPVQRKSYTDTPIKNLATLDCDFECNRWREGRADVIVVPNKHREMVGRDMFKPLRIHFKQKDSPNAEGKNINSIDSTPTCPIRKDLAIKYKNLTTRVGRSIDDKVKSYFRTNYTPVHLKGRRVSLHLEKQVEEELKNLQNNGH